MLSIGNEELAKCLTVDKFGSVTCHICGAQHKLAYGTDEEGKPSYIIGFINCPVTNKTYLATIKGKLLSHMTKKQPN